MITARGILAAGALLLGGLAMGVTPAQAYDSTSCLDGLDGKPVCTTTWAPAPPPPDHLKPAPLPPPGYDYSTPINPGAPAPAAHVPAPYVPAPVAPAPIYNAPVAPAPVYVPPAPVQQQPAAPVYNAPVAPAPTIIEALVATESGQEASAPTTAPSAAVTPSASPVATSSGGSMMKPVQDIKDSGTIVAADQVSSDAPDSTPVVLFVALVVAGTVAMVVILRFGPGISGVRGMARTILRP
jgi:hypothetical protein